MSDNNDLIEAAKRKAAYRAVEEHFRTDSKYVGIGSGSTIMYGIEAIKEKLAKDPPSHQILFIPTGFASRKAVEKAGLLPWSFDSLSEDTMLDVAFDGADEVDEELNCIKGGGACLFQEKLVATRAKKFVCIADYRKDQKRLLSKWPSIPIEVAPIAHATVLHELRRLGSKNPKLRESTMTKAGPLQTDQGFYIIDAPFPPLLCDSDLKAGKKGDGRDGGVYDVPTLAGRIKAIAGVLEVGLFFGLNGEQSAAQNLQGGQKPVAVYFGLENGEVKMRTAPEA
ncbi:hypothetical protein ANO11243_081800 [Dothideomycetidae sp. 11243]|nr:hypothetical protein ANO11243_081800 [fungal sp. No.11243]